MASGYGVFSRGHVNVLAHRDAWEKANEQPIPAGMVVRHSCDNPPCINPDHLLLGTQADNMRDKVLRGRTSTNGNERKTHCPSGHAYTTENTYVNPKGERACRTCQRAHWRAYDRRRRNNRKIEAA